MQANRFLAVDQGNSFFKLTLFMGDKLEKTSRIPADASEDAFAIVEEWCPDSAAFCSVGRIDSRLVESLRMAVDGNLLVLSHSTPMPVGIKYATPATLGLDRVVLAAGTALLYKHENVMVVDAGTAVTLDVLGSESFQTNDGRKSVATFLGGRIAPGLHLRFASLRQFTASLPLVDAEGSIPVAGDSTESSIRSGVVMGLADEIVETYRQYSKAFSCTRAVITGGDAAILINEISSRIAIDYVPDLMAHGLHYIYKYNENK